MGEKVARMTIIGNSKNLMDVRQVDLPRFSLFALGCNVSAQVVFFTTSERVTTLGMDAAFDVSCTIQQYVEWFY